ncbi:MAG TPA: acyltransferase [Tepidisphaeraceae bacterium]|nr:acyltransferase [Tepidisphaeraceae bacterium]
MRVGNIFTGTAAAAVTGDEAASGASTKRLPLLDAAKFIAAAGVVLVHSAPPEELGWADGAGRFAVPFFGAASVFLLGNSLWRKPDRPFLEFAANRFTRLYVPFFVWSGIYLALMELKFVILHEHRHVAITAATFVAGSAHHLWFLPSLFFILLAAFVPMRAASRHPLLNGWLAALLLASGIVAALPVLDDFRLLHGFGAGTGYLFVLTWSMIPAVCWGGALAALMRMQNAASVLQSPWVSWLGLAGCIACTAALCLRGRSRMLENIAGAALVIAALPSPARPLPPWIRTLGSYCYGIYLSHVAFLLGTVLVLDQAHVRPSIPRDFLICLIALACSTVFCWVMSRWELGRLLVMTS